MAYLTFAREITNKFKGLSVTQILQGENTQADWLACLASYSESNLQGIKEEFLLEPSVSSLDGIEVDPVEVEPGWMDPIVTYLTTGDLLNEKTDARRVRYRVA